MSSGTPDSIDDKEPIFVDDNYIRIQQQRLLETYIRVCGFSSLNDPNYIPFKSIQNPGTLEKVIKLLPALRTVFQTYNIRSITNKRQDKRLVLNLLRQLLRHMGYTLHSRTYHLVNKSKITSSTKYKIIPLEKSTAHETYEQSDSESHQDPEVEII